MLLHWTVVFLILAVICAVFGFGFAAATFAGMAKILFVVFLVIFVISLVSRSGRAI